MSATTVLCTAVHECTGGREGRCTRLTHTGTHHCFWCGLTWDEIAEAS